MNLRPLTLDLDGVVCRPPFGLNVGISRNLRLLPLPVASESSPSTPRGFFHAILHALRYAGRRPMPDARAGLLAIRACRTPILVTARSAVVLPFVEAWLRRHNLRECFSAIYANDTGLRAAHFKLAKVRELATTAHVDDDGATAYFLASNGVPRVYLRDWPLNRGLPYPPAVVVVRSLLEVAEHVAKGAE